MDLFTPITNAGRAMKMYAGRLEKLGIYTLRDFLFHIPSRYEDFSLVSKIASVQEGETVTVQGKVIQIKNNYTKRFKKIQTATVGDDTGEIHILWFNQPYITQSIHEGDSISLAGKVEKSNNKITLIAPDYEIINPDNPVTIHTARLVPIYPETKGISSKWIRRQVYKILQENKEKIKEYIPYSIIDRLHLYDYVTAIAQIHFPDTLEQVVKAKERLGFDEVFLLQLGAQVRRQEWQGTLRGNAFVLEPYKEQLAFFWNSLPFELTGAQRKAIHDIFTDIAQTKPMNRLLQGDVGSGKTVVAAAGIYMSFLNGFQSVLMAPTEILAEQHFATLSKLLTPLGLHVALTTGSKKPRIAEQADVLVGTHAVLSKSTVFDRLGFVAIDEQQRFGVEQRAIIRKKGNNPHVLTMTATPIPRTVALTLYGDLDLSVLDEMPKGRKEIKTWLVPNTKRESGYTWIENQIKEGDQAFIVCPFIEESENMLTVKAAAKEFERLQKEVFPNVTLGLLHGKMKAKEKDQVLDAFRNKDISILVATPVVEVGIDIPNATIIVIEAAERFGLAQLHQLRGRVGRGDKQSYCLLFTESLNELTRMRLSRMHSIHNGAELAELDYKMRGPGEIYGTQQSGQRMLKIASFSDLSIIEKAKKAAEEIFPQLASYQLLQEKVAATNTKQISPD